MTESEKSGGFKIKLPEDVTRFAVGNVIRNATIWGDGWTARIEIDAANPATMERAVKALASLHTPQEAIDAAKR